jgi:membrane-associated phospholipid phosphatase
MRVLLHIGIGLFIGAQSAWAGVVEQDLKTLFTYRNLGVATAGLGLAGIAHTWDNELKGELEGRLLFEELSGLSNIYGESSFSLPVSLMLWGAGEMTERPRLAETGFALLRTLGLTQLVVAPLKLGVRRERPDKSNNLSFPSGHTANSFAIARLMHRRHGKRIGIPLYILGSFVAAGRIEDDLHFLSDVVMGAVLGTIVGNSVTWGASENLNVYPTLRGAALTIKLDL